MVSTISLEEKYSKIRRRLCFYLDIEDQELSRSLSRRLQDMGLQQEWVLSARVTHAVVGSGGAGPAAEGAARRARGSRADAMLQRCAAPPPPPHARLSVRQAISLLDKLYDTFFAAPRKSHVKLFTKDFIKIEFLDKLWKPVYKEFEEFPLFSLEPDVPREKRDKKQSPEQQPNDINQNVTNTSQKMTRKNRPRIKDKEEKEKGGYCEMCHVEYADLEAHRGSARHAGFVRDHANFLALDSLIAAGADVATFLAKDAAAAAAAAAERRSLRKLCNGDAERTPRRPRRSQSPDSTVDGDPSPLANGHDDERRHSARCAKRPADACDDRAYYKVVGVSTKLRSSGGFVVRKKESPPPCNGAKPLVVKFRKVRRSELSVLSDEAEQFMFPKRASSSSSTASDDDGAAPSATPATPAPVATPVTHAPERRRLARPLALKEESSEDDSWPDSPRRRKRRVAVPVRRPRRQPPRRVSSAAAAAAADEPEDDPELTPVLPSKPERSPTPEPAPEDPVVKSEPAIASPEQTPEQARDASPRSDGCMRWEEGRLRYPPAVERLEFAFERVPHSEPWFDTFRRQDERRLAVKNVPEFFALYSTEPPKLPYEIGQLPPLKPNCCPLSALAVPASRGRGGRGGGRGGGGRGGRGAAPRAGAYGTRGTLLAARARRTAALDTRPRKSPREHASTLAMAGLLRRAPADAGSTASDDTGSDTLASLRRAALGEPSTAAAAAAADHAARLRCFLDEVFSDAAEAVLEEPAPATAVLAGGAPDVPGLVAAADTSDHLRAHIAATQPAAPATQPAARRPRPRKKNRTGWPSKRKTKKGSRAGSLDSRPLSDTPSARDRLSDVDDEPPSPADEAVTETDSVRSEESAPIAKEESVPLAKEESAPLAKEESVPLAKEESALLPMEELAPLAKEEPKREKTPPPKESKDVSRTPTKLEDREADGESWSGRGRRRAATASWQPVVRVQRVEVCGRRLRSAAPAPAAPAAPATPARRR